ncbi:MAG: 3-deoxy-D-manno-octulosonic acid transferase [Proteobacteria bacterium]|nr:3-deoxy-D-manno-octulosonic acid transferase [Pseudomonadota bacterium]
MGRGESLPAPVRPTPAACPDRRAASGAQVTVLPALWSGAARLAAPGLRLLLARRARRGKEIATRLAERRGIDPTPRPPGPLIWLHAASVGESVSVLPVVAALAAEGASVLLTTGTVTSASLLARRLPELGLEARVRHRFAPLDVPGWAARFLDHWRPDAAGFVESEIWPNLLAACGKRGIPVMLLNARLSPRSFARWRRVPGFARQVLGGFAAIAAQSAADADRLRRLGANRVSAPGNLKFAAPDLPADPAELARWRAALAGRPVWLAASTHPGEEGLVAAAHRTLAAAFPGLVTILVPRHPERGPAIAAVLGAGGLGAGALGPGALGPGALGPGALGPDALGPGGLGSIAVARRALGEGPPAGGIWLADTLGDLGLWYRLAPIVLVGRSLLAPGGGQNPLEPARLGCAVAVGPHTGNFAEPMARLAAAGAVTTVADAAGLAGFVAEMLRDPAARAAMGTRAAAAARGADDLPAQLATALLGMMRGRSGETEASGGARGGDACAGDPHPEDPRATAAAAPSGPG